MMLDAVRIDGPTGSLTGWRSQGTEPFLEQHFTLTESR